MKAGNSEQARNALQGITDVEYAAEPLRHDRLLVIVRANRERDAVDSLRRNGVAAHFPSYEELVPTKQILNGHPVRRMRRVGVIPGYVFADAVPQVEELLYRIVGAIDVARSDAGRPLRIADEDFQVVRRIEVELSTPAAKPKAPEALKIGELVRLVDDVTRRWPPGRIVRLAREGRIGVEIELMKRKVYLTVLPFQIERV